MKSALGAAATKSLWGDPSIALPLRPDTPYVDILNPMEGFRNVDVLFEVGTVTLVFGGHGK